MHRILIILFTFCFLFSLRLCGACPEEQVEFANRKLKQLAGQLPISVFPEKDTIMEVPQVVKGKSLVFELNDKKVVCHIGVSLFSNETKQMLDKGICNFLERYFLELLLQKDQVGVKRKLEEYHVSLLVNGKDFTKGRFRSVAEVLQLMCMPVNFALRRMDRQAEAVWIFNDYHLCMRFPLYRELIDGTDKKESDEELYNLLQVAVLSPVDLMDEQVARENLQPETGDVYIRKGETFLIKPMSSDRYYVEEGGSFVPLFRKQYPEYSMNNLFLTYRNGDGKTLQITHRKYGHFTPEISIPLPNFLACFKDDFLTACHTGYNKNGELETMVVFNHKTLNYIHLLRVHTTKERLFSSHPVLKADFYSNIPQHYINSLLK
jgi:hypothetical protein